MFCIRKQNCLRQFPKKIREDNYLDSLTNMYNYIKKVTNDYYLSTGRMHSSYYYLLKKVIELEEKYESYRYDGSFDLDCKDRSFLDYLVYNVRQHLQGRDSSKCSSNLTDKCVTASLFVRDFCKDNSECHVLRIHPGYDARAGLFDGNGFHYANIIKYGGNYYLVDVTYSQFFNEVKENLASMGIVDFKGCSVGTFVGMDERRKNVADEILKNGYIMLTDEIFKIYLDSFTISFRNGLYYEENNDFSYTTDYTIDDYIKFLNGSDSQVLREGREVLGYQKKPLKDYSMDFRKRA